MTGGVTAGDVAKAHMADLQTQGKYDVRYLRYWVDEQQGKVFCLVEAPSADAASAVHRGPRPGRRRHLPGPGGLLMHPWRCDRSANWPAAPAWRLAMRPAAAASTARKSLTTQQGVLS
jgi:hypothetical protein